MLFENIAAISTAPIASGVAIIRISGESPLDIAEKMFISSVKPRDFEPYKMYVGTIDCGNIKDFGMCVYFKAPRSYTGEDMVEFHCHGGVAISRAVLTRALELGARLAERGEFTRRAFLNGKMSLSACEGLVDMIYAESEAEARSGYYLYKEKLFKKIGGVQDKLTSVLALIDANIDYPEEDIESAEFDNIKNTLIECKNILVPLVESYKDSSKLSSGVNVAICGRPNAGKSSLLNALLNCDKAIVTDIEGTTRDVVEGKKDIRGVRFNFYDTAGIRDSRNEIERIGIERSKKHIESAHVVIMLCDGTKKLTEDDRTILDSLKGRNYLLVANKRDITGGRIPFECDLAVSALTGENIEALERLLVEKVSLDNVSFDGDFLTEQRHYEALKKALDKLDAALFNMGAMSLDVIAEDIKDAWKQLGLISGETCNEDIINEIFAKFCVGK